MTDLEKLKKFDNDYPMKWRKYYLHTPSKTKWRMDSSTSIRQIKPIMDNISLPMWLVNDSYDFVEISKEKAFEINSVIPQSLSSMFKAVQLNLATETWVAIEGISDTHLYKKGSRMPNHNQFEFIGRCSSDYVQKTNLNSCLHDKTIKINWDNAYLFKYVNNG